LLDEDDRPVFECDCFHSLIFPDHFLPANFFSLVSQAGEIKNQTAKDVNRNFSILFATRQDGLEMRRLFLGGDNADFNLSETGGFEPAV